MTRLFFINSLKNSGLNLTDLETQIKALRLSWIPRVLDERVGPWKSLLLKCNYDARDLYLHLNGSYQKMTDLHNSRLGWLTVSSEVFELFIPYQHLLQSQLQWNSFKNIYTSIRANTR